MHVSGHFRWKRPKTQADRRCGRPFWGSPTTLIRRFCVVVRRLRVELEARASVLHPFSVDDALAVEGVPAFDLHFVALFDRGALPSRLRQRAGTAELDLPRLHFAVVGLALNGEER